MAPDVIGPSRTGRRGSSPGETKVQGSRRLLLALGDSLQMIVRIHTLFNSSHSLHVLAAPSHLLTGPPVGPAPTTNAPKLFSFGLDLENPIVASLFPTTVTNVEKR